MCLIAHVPAGKSLTREVFDNAAAANPHGIGVMSPKGVEKFYGNKQLKRARRYVAGLVNEGLPHAVHWRWATHGSKCLALCHPFKLPNVDAWLMHNGVISGQSADVNEDTSDTLAYVNKLVDAPATHESLEYWDKVCKDFGASNKGVVMYPDGHFIILNEDEGVRLDGIWYSNQYSLPVSLRKGSYFTPSRLRPVEQYTPSWHRGFGYGSESGSYYDSRGSYYDTGRSASPYGGPFGAMVYWSSQQKAYGFWEGTKFQVLEVKEGEVRETRVELKPNPPAETDDSARKCTRCRRYKDNPPHGSLSCWCRPEDVARFLGNLKKTEEAAPSGPTTESVTQTQTALALEPCEHGVDNWENCPKCIAELEEVDLASEVQQWLADRQGVNWQLHAPDNGGYPKDTSNPQVRADELAEKIIYLPKASEK